MDTLYYSATVFATCSSDHNNKTDWKCINMCLPFVGNATTVFANGANNRCIYLGCPKGVLDFNEGKNAYTINELSLAFPYIYIYIYIYSSSAKPLQLFYISINKYSFFRIDICCGLHVSLELWIDILPHSCGVRRLP